MTTEANQVVFSSGAGISSVKESMQHEEQYELFLTTQHILEELPM
jgi:hypothetical protein